MRLFWGQRETLKLFEYEAKEIAREFRLSTPNGAMVTSVEEALSSLDDLNVPVVLKAQVLTAGRKKAGGVLFASSKDEVGIFTEKLLGSKINNELVSRILIEEKISTVNELYAGISVDRECRCYLLLVSKYGGSDIEQLATSDPSKVLRNRIDPLTRLDLNDAKRIVQTLNYQDDRVQKLALVLVRLHEIAAKYDAEFVEANPLIETLDKEFMAADFKIVIDDNSLFRHPEFSSRLRERSREFTDRELEAQKHGLSYVELDGDIGVLGNGAGLVMATLDLIEHFNGSPANFCDVGGGAEAKRVDAALTILLKNEKVKVVLVNVLGGITRCDEVAKGIVEARNGVDIKKSLVVRMVGTFEDEGKRILTEASIPYYDTMDEAAEEAVRLARRM
jgi:succinyl-CoA synthetase beta subunit